MAYTATVTINEPVAERISRRLGMITGVVDLNPYHATGAEITEITGMFKTLHSVVTDGLSENGYVVRWDTSDKCFHAFYPTSAQAAVTTDKLTITASGAASITNGQSVTVDATFRSAVDAGVATEVGAVDVGEINFVAIGTI